MRKQYKLLITISELTHSSQVRNLHDLVTLIDRNKFDIEVGALSTGDAAQADIEAAGVKVFPLRLQPTRKFYFKQIPDLLKSPFLIAYKQYDIIHSLLYQSIFTEALFFKTLTGAKYIYTKSNLDWDNHSFNWNLKSKLADCIISISNATDELLNKHHFSDKIEKIFLGIDTNYFIHSGEKRETLREKHKIPANALVYGCAAQFVEWKEHLTVLKAFENLLANGHSAYLLYCGPNHRDAYYEQVLAEIDKSPYKNHIRLLGSLADMPGFYSAIDCFVLPSRYETFGYVYIEAMSCGRPVIGCRAAGPLEIIEENRTGLFTKMSDHNDLAKQMRTYATSDNLLHEHGKAARERAVKIFSKEIMAAKTQELYEKLLNKSIT